MTLYKAIEDTNLYHNDKEIIMDMKEEMKKLALKYAEKYAELSIEFAMELMEKGSELSENKIDDAVVLAGKGFLEEALKELADKIDGEEE